MSMELMRLRDCAASTKLGMVDQWPGPEMNRLSLQGFVERVGPGWKVTPAGLRHLKSRVEDLERL